jgi:hypothetical protein
LHGCVAGCEEVDQAREPHPRQNPRRLGALNCKSRYGGAGIARSEPGDEMSCSGRAEPGDRDPSSFARAFWCSRNRTSRQMPKMALRAADFSTKCGLMCTTVLLLNVVR